jgi:hypothetical protein
MKIKLDAQGAVSILTVTGPVAGGSFDVLKAGIAKLLTSGILVVDLTQAEVAPELLPRLRELEGSDENLRIVLTQTDKLLAGEAQFRARLSAAQAEKARLAAKLGETDALGAEIKKLRRENGELQAVVNALEATLSERVKSRKPPFSSEAIENALGDVHDVIAKVFPGLLGHAEAR